MSTHYTVIGGNGFIGSEIVSRLKAAGEQVVVPSRNDAMLFEKDLGIVIYAAGNGNCVNEPFSVLESNTTLLSQILQNAKFHKLIYISSTRLYMGQEASSEDDDLTICADDNRKLFNLTKLVSEELCLRSGHEVIIVRPSNVYGLALKSNLFLPSIIRNAINNGHIDMFVTPDYAKDYVSVVDVANVIYMLSKNNNHSVYNIASGVNVTAGEIADLIQKHTQCTVTWHKGYTGEYFPVTDISRTVDEFHYEYSRVLTDIEIMISNFKQVLSGA